MLKPSATPLPKLNRHLRGVQPYPPGKPIEDVKREFGLDEVVKMASNENPYGPSPKAVKAMVAVAGEMALYPDGGAYYLKRAIAAHLGVAPEAIMLGNGTDELPGLLAQAYLGPKRGMVTSQYAFVRYRMAAEAVGAPCALIPMKNMRHDVKAIARATTEATGMICLDVPCNPTGGVATTREIEWLMRHVPATTLVMVDQAYYEFCAGQPGFPEGVELSRKWPNMIAMRTFSKAYGLAGLRVGYGVARPEIVTDVDRVRPPFNVSRMAQAAAIAALGDQKHVRRCVAGNAKGLAQLTKGFDKLGARWWPSHANFILVDFGRPAGPVFMGLQKLGVITRPMAGYGLASHLRISVGTPAENRKCLAALKTVLAEPAA